MLKTLFHTVLLVLRDIMVWSALNSAMFVLRSSFWEITGDFIPQSQSFGWVEITCVFTQTHRFHHFLDWENPQHRTVKTPFVMVKKKEPTISWCDLNRRLSWRLVLRAAWAAEWLWLFNPKVQSGVPTCNGELQELTESCPVRSLACSSFLELWALTPDLVALQTFSIKPLCVFCTVDPSTADHDSDSGFQPLQEAQSG